MCLIITGPAKSIVSTLINNPLLLQDIYESNGDGVGAMYANSKGKLRVYKALPKSWQQASDWIKRLPNDDRMLAMHWRWRTHGDINLDQCHPYHVTDSLAMMHNGVLHTGNKADATKSDTWHFIQDYLADLVVDAPKVVHKPSMVEFIGEYIGDNRFVFMDGDGDMTIVNQDQGIEHGDLWFSNTYAWSPSLLIPGYSSRKWAGWDQDYATTGASKVSTAITEPAHGPAWSEEKVANVLAALDANDADTLADFLKVQPFTVTQFLMSRFQFSFTGSLEVSAGSWLSDDEMAVCEAIIDSDVTAVSKIAITNPQRVAECICYYLVWDSVSLTVGQAGVLDDEDEDEVEDGGPAVFGMDDEGEVLSYGSDGPLDFELFIENGRYGYSVYCGERPVSTALGFDDVETARQRMRTAISQAKQGVAV